MVIEIDFDGSTARTCMVGHNVFGLRIGGVEFYSTSVLVNQTRRIFAKTQANRFSNCLPVCRLVHGQFDRFYLFRIGTGGHQSKFHGSDRHVVKSVPRVSITWAYHFCISNKSLFSIQNNFLWMDMTRKKKCRWRSTQMRPVLHLGMVVGIFNESFQ